MNDRKMYAIRLHEAEGGPYYTRFLFFRGRFFCLVLLGFQHEKASIRETGKRIGASRRVSDLINGRSSLGNDMAYSGEDALKIARRLSETAGIPLEVSEDELYSLLDAEYREWMGQI